MLAYLVTGYALPVAAQVDQQLARAQGGALISADGDTIAPPAPVVLDATTLKGDGWTATVGPGWTVQPGPRPGSFRVVRQ